MQLAIEERECKNSSISSSRQEADEKVGEMQQLKTQNLSLKSQIEDFASRQKNSQTLEAEKQELLNNCEQKCLIIDHLNVEASRPANRIPTAACTGISVFQEENGPIGDAFTTELAGMVLKTLSAKVPFYKNSSNFGWAVTFDGNFELTAAHNHYGDEIRAEMKRFQGIVQKQAVSSKDPPRNIIGKALKEVSKEAWGRIRRSFAAKNIRSIRHENNLEPANPKSLQLLVVPKAYHMYGEETFLKFDGWNAIDRVLIFSTDRCLDLLVAERKLGADGTWDVVPLLRAQLDDKRGSV
uniref:Uncharacterized protein n=1 Tax=Ditylenchus dipsaci TaxID=166011 RepID=A0A915E9P4_9BILA